MIGFELAEPRTLAEAMRLLDPSGPSVRPIAGGTAVMLMLKSGLFRPQRLVSLRRIEPRYSDIEARDGALRIGAMARLAELEHSEEVARHAPVIARTLRTLSNVRVRNVATVGGHLAHADPHMDLPPVLAALGASISVASPRGERTLAVEKLYSGYLATVLAPDELIVELAIPAQGKARAAYAKVTARSADDWPAVGIAVAIEAEGGATRRARAFVGAATETPTRLAAAEKILTGATVDDAALRRAGEAAAAEADPIADQHGSAAYKRQLIRVHFGRAVRAALFGAA
jgi:aerobic carbon-monoxide dehydrogenase medium subunit